MLIARQEAVAVSFRDGEEDSKAGPGSKKPPAKMWQAPYDHLHNHEHTMMTGDTGPVDRKAWAARSFIVTRYQQASHVRVEHTRLQSSNIRLHLGQFLLQLIAQGLPPVGFVLAAFHCGVPGLKNMEMFPTQFRFYTQLIFFSQILALVVGFYNGSIPNISGESIALLVGSYALFRSVIALKYGYMHPMRYKRWFASRKCHLAPLDETERISENLANWFRADRTHIEREVAYTSMRLGVCLTTSAFTVTGSQPELQLSPSADSGEPQKFSLYEAITSILVAASAKTSRKVLQGISVLAGLVHGAATAGVVGMVLGLRPLPQSTLEWVAAIEIFIFSSLIGNLIAMFATSAYVDYERRYHSLRMLEAAVVYKSPSNAEDDMFMEKPPAVSLLISENVHMFLLARRVLMNIGLRYHRRLQAYTSLLLLILAGVAVYLAVSAFEGTLQPSPSTWQMAIDSFLLIMLLVACIVKGSSANSLATQHMALLTARQLEVHDSLAAARRGGKSAMMKDVICQLEATHGALEGTKNALAYDDKLHSVKIVGLRASPALIRSIALVASTFMSFLVRVLAGNGGGFGV